VIERLVLVTGPKTLPFEPGMVGLSPTY